MKVKNENFRLREQNNIVTSPTKRIGGRMKVRESLLKPILIDLIELLMIIKG